MGIIRIKDGMVLDANDCWFREMGFTREEVLGQPAYELKGWIGKEQSRLQQLLNEGQPFRNLEFRPRTKTGEERIVLSSAEVIDIAGEPCFLFVANDITERKRAEDAVHESEERFRQLTENIREVFWMNTPDLSESLYISPAYESIWGRTRESLRQNPRSFMEAIHPEDRPKVIAVFGQKLEHAFEMEYRVVRPDGSIRWIWDRGFPIQDAAGQVYRITGIAEDVTDHKRAEERLRATSEQLRALTASLSSAREEEGLRIAREIHDELGSLLTSLRWELERVDKILCQCRRASAASAAGREGRKHAQADRHDDQHRRRIAAEMRPSILDDLGLPEAIEWQAQQFQARTASNVIVTAGWKTRR
jgi:PAS domain S-box-containing protein